MEPTGLQDKAHDYMRDSPPTFILEIFHQHSLTHNNHTSLLLTFPVQGLKTTQSPKLSWFKGSGWYRIQPSITSCSFVMGLVLLFFCFNEISYDLSINKEIYYLFLLYSVKGPVEPMREPRERKPTLTFEEKPTQMGRVAYSRNDPLAVRRHAGLPTKRATP